MFEVLTFTLCDGWINCWSIEDANGNRRPQTFATEAEAQAEIDEIFADEAYDVEAGDRSLDECSSPEDFRIVPVSP